jgi:hypothetical protein
MSSRLPRMALTLPVTDAVRDLLERMVAYPVAHKDNIDALNLQVLAAKALLKLDAPPPKPKRRQATVGEIGQRGGLAR